MDDVSRYLLTCCDKAAGQSRLLIVCRSHQSETTECVLGPRAG